MFGKYQNGLTSIHQPEWYFTLFFLESTKCKLFSYQNIYTSISIALISFTGRMKFIPRWTPLALSPRKGTENTNDVRNSPLFLECCYFKIASTIVYTHGLTDLCIFALRIMGSHYFQATFTIIHVHDRWWLEKVKLEFSSYFITMLFASIEHI